MVSNPSGCCKVPGAVALGCVGGLDGTVAVRVGATGATGAGATGAGATTGAIGIGA